MHNCNKTQINVKQNSFIVECPHICKAVKACKVYTYAYLRREVKFS